VELSRSTLANWVVQIGQRLDPVMEAARQVLLTSPVVGSDETTVQVMKEPGRANTTRSYMWVFRGESRDGPIVMFQYHPTRSGSVPAELFEKYEGIVQVDGYAGYDALEAGGKVRLAGCWAHVRRKFVEAARVAKGSGKTGSADVAIGMIRQLYAIESRAADGGLSPEAIRQLRQEEARPIVERFGQWLEKRRGETPPKGLLGKAISYALGQWSRLTIYLEDGRLRIDNNLVENAIRPFALGRKNWLFSGHPRGAKASANIYSLIETAKANGLEPYRYLRCLLERLPYAQTADDFKALLPPFIKAQLPDSSI
jgi:transposase